MCNAMPAYSMRSPHTVCGNRIQYAVPHTVCGHRIQYAVTAYSMRAPHTVCSACVFHALSAYCMRYANPVYASCIMCLSLSYFPHIGCGMCISYVDSPLLYAAPESCMLRPHIVCGGRIMYAATAYHMREPHTVCGCLIQ